MATSATSTRVNEDGARAAEQSFFAALQSADSMRLDEVLTEDFVLVDVMRGGLITRAMLLDALGARHITFDAIDVLESEVRLHGATAIIVGRTRMRGHAGTSEWSVSSRYTHVYVGEAGRWRLASAQGTPIAAE